MCVSITRRSASLERPGLPQHVVGDPDLADVVQQEAVLDALVVEQGGIDDLRELRRVLRHAVGVRAGAEVLGLERAGEGRDRLLVGRLDEEPLASLELEEAAQILGVEEELLLGPLVRHQPERPLRQAAGELLDRLEELERAERLADECVRARRAALVVGRARGAGEQHDRHLGRRGLRPQAPAERDAVDVRQRDVEHDHVRRAAPPRAPSPRRRCPPRRPPRR